MGVDELVGKEAAVFVVEDSFQLIGTGGDINLVVDGEELAAGNFDGVIAVERFDSKIGVPLAQLVENLRELILRQRENYGDGLDLRNDQQPIGVRGVDNVSGIDQAKAYAARNRGGDSGIGELKFG